MRGRNDRLTTLVCCMLGVIPVVWLALLMAPGLHGGLPGIVTYLSTAFDQPFHIVWTEDSLKTVLLFFYAYVLAVAIYFSTKRNYRRREEHGSAKWGEPVMLCRKYRDKRPEENIILTQHVRIGLDGRRHRRNLNVLCCGGSGSGKTRFYCKPTLMNCSNSSFVCLDPKGELTRDVGGLLQAKGYEVKVFDLVDMARSHCYNPFVYLKDDKDVLKLVTNLIRNTTPKGSNTNDPFWERSETALLEALILYLLSEAPPEEQNFAMIMEMIAAAEVREEDETYQSPLDELFERLEMRDSEHLAVKQYHIFKLAAGVICSKQLLNHDFSHG